MFAFLELSGFANDWTAIGLTDLDLQLLQKSLLSRPEQGQIVARTGGLRKTRFAPPNWRKGKSGAVRVCYVDFRRFGLLLLVAVYSKRLKANISPQERLAIKKVIARIERDFEIQARKRRKRK